MDSSFHIENTGLIVERMLQGLAKEHPDFEPAMIYTVVRPEHTFQLLDLPLSITFNLAMLAGGDRVKNLVDRIWQSEMSGNLNHLSEAANHLNWYLMLATTPSQPDQGSIHIEDLALCLSNYVLLRYALFRFLETGEKEVALPWSDTFQWEDLPKENRVPFYLAMRWPAMVVLFMNKYLSRASSGLGLQSEFNESFPYPIFSIVPEDESEADKEILGQAVGLHRVNQDYYRLWLRFLYNRQTDFYFEALWSDDLPYVETILNLMADIELEALEMSSELSSTWAGMGATERIQRIFCSQPNEHTLISRSQAFFPLKFSRR